MAKAAEPGGFDVLSAALGALTGDVGAVSAVLPPHVAAIVQATGALYGMATQVLNVSATFVKAFNPAAVEAMSIAFENLQAAIGGALGPIVAVAKVIANELNAVFTALAPVIRPVVEQLAGVFKLVADAVASVLMPLVTAMAPLVTAVVEIFKGLAAIILPLIGVLLTFNGIFMQLFAPVLAMAGLFLSMILPVFRVLGLLAKMVVLSLSPLLAGLQIMTAVITAFTDVFSAIFAEVFALFDDVMGTIQGFVNDLIKAVIDPIKSVVKEIVRYFRQFMDAVREFLGIKRPTEGPKTAAAGEAKFINVEEIGKQARLAAAGQVGPIEAQTNILESILAWLRDDLPKAIKDALAGGAGEALQGRGEGYDAFASFREARDLFRPPNRRQGG